MHALYTSLLRVTFEEEKDSMITKVTYTTHTSTLIHHEDTDLPLFSLTSLSFSFMITIRILLLFPVISVHSYQVHLKYLSFRIPILTQIASEEIVSCTPL